MKVYTVICNWSNLLSKGLANGWHSPLWDWSCSWLSPTYLSESLWFFPFSAFFQSVNCVWVLIYSFLQVTPEKIVCQAQIRGVGEAMDCQASLRLICHMENTAQGIQECGWNSEVEHNPVETQLCSCQMAPLLLNVIVLLRIHCYSTIIIKKVWTKDTTAHQTVVLFFTQRSFHVLLSWLKTLSFGDSHAHSNGNGPCCWREECPKVQDCP